jgi:murein DD-endopeptidase MepM/ murein hydrolase activator NlpD
MNRSRPVAPLGLLLVLLPGLPLLLSGCGGGDAGSATGPEVTPPTPTGPSLVWPLSRSEGVDADSVHAPYGPRALPSRYDFHAGIDLPAPRGTRANAVLPGRVVEVRHWNGTSSGAGNAVLLAHDGGVHTNYLHLDEIQVVVGQQLHAGDRVGTVGSTGATYPHLHLGYFVGLQGTSGDERLSRNPLELLPTAGMQGQGSVFQGDTIHFDLPLRGMTVRKVILEGSSPDAPGGTGRLEFDYYAVVARGATPRHEQEQFGVHVDAGRPAEGRFELTVHPADPEFRVERARLVGIRGDTLHVAERPGAQAHRP